MSITYEEALSTLTSMFGEPWTQETLDLVLRHYEGHMENTVEAVLANGDKDPQILLDRLKEGKSPTDSDISIDEELARQLADEERRRSVSSRGATTTNQRQQQQQLRSSSQSTTNNSNNSAAASPPVSEWKGRGTPTTLPTDFLRIPGQPIPTPSSSSGSSTSNITDEDERLARMLQDELFSQELANNPEFAHLARGGGRVAGSNRRAATARAQPRIGEMPSRQGSNRHNNAQQQGDGGQQIMENLKEMGENTKKRLQMFAATFNAKMQQQFNKPPGGNTNSSSSAGAAAAAAAGGGAGAGERRSLLDSTDDDDNEQQIEFQDMGFGDKKTM